jgi:hypothetical protein
MRIKAAAVAAAQVEERTRMQAELDSGRAAQDPDIAPLWSGAGVGLIHGVAPAEAVTTEILAQAAAVMERLHGTVA